MKIYKGPKYRKIDKSEKLEISKYWNNSGGKCSKSGKSQKIENSKNRETETESIETVKNIDSWQWIWVIEVPVVHYEKLWENLNVVDSFEP